MGANWLFGNVESSKNFNRIRVNWDKESRRCGTMGIADDAKMYSCSSKLQAIKTFDFLSHVNISEDIFPFLTFNVIILVFGNSSITCCFFSLRRPS